MRDHCGFMIIHAEQEPSVDPALRVLAKAILEVQDLSFSEDGLETLLSHAEIVTSAALALDLVFGRMKAHTNRDPERLVTVLTVA